jgi:hypothetical protein
LHKQEQEEFIKHFEFTESHSHRQNQEYDYIGFDATEVIVSDRFLYYSQQLRDCFCEAGIDPGYFHPMEKV